MRKHPGVETRHRKACALNSAGSRCSCQPSYRAEAYDPDRRRRIFKTFPSAAAARSWRSAMQVKIKTGEAGAIDSPTLRDAYAAWATRAADGVIRNNRGEVYKPSVLRSYNEVMHKHVLPRLGSRKLTDVRLVHVQDLIEELHRAGLAARTVHNVVAPLRVVFGDAIRREQARINPCIGVRLPSGETARDRIATPAEAVLLLEALESDRLLWALAFYAGLRAGEIMALDWSCVDLPARNLEIRRSYDPKAREFISPKTVKGTRRVPFPTLLVPYLMAERRPSGLVCGDGVEPWRPTTVRNRALRAWGWNPRKVDGELLPLPDKAQLAPIKLHECRHTYASHMLASGVDIVKVSKWMGHSSIQITVDRYGHLVPGDETAAMQRFETYLTEGTA
jgi:integrase